MLQSLIGEGHGPLIESFLMNTFIDSSLVDIGPVVLKNITQQG